MAYLQTLYKNLRAIAFKDPIMLRLASGDVSWADVSCTTEEDRMFREHCETGEGASILADVQKELDKLHGRAKKEKKVMFQAPQEEIRPSTLLLNPHQIKTIVARNLPRDITMDELRFLFEKYGVVRDVYIPKNLDKNSPYFGTIKGFALIKFLNADESTNAYVGETAKLNLRGKLITIEFAKEDR